MINTKNFGPEDHVQYKVVQYLDLQYKHVLYCHVPNQRQSKIQYIMKLKALGVKSGVPDLLIFNPVGRFIGLALELKSLKGRAKKTQLIWLDSLKARGWSAHCCKSFEAAKTVIDNYFKYEDD